MKKNIIYPILCHLILLVLLMVFIEKNWNLILIQHKKIQSYCKKKNIEYMCSAWDLTSLKQLISLKMRHIKIPSACNNNIELLTYLFKKFNGFCHISLGMTTQIEEGKFLIWLKNIKNKKLILYACTSDYPVKQEDICLLEISRLKKKYEKKNSLNRFFWTSSRNIGRCSCRYIGCKMG